MTCHFPTSRLHPSAGEPTRRRATTTMTRAVVGRAIALSLLFPIFVVTQAAAQERDNPSSTEALPDPLTLDHVLRFARSHRAEITAAHAGRPNHEKWPVLIPSANPKLRQAFKMLEIPSQQCSRTGTSRHQLEGSDRRADASNSSASFAVSLPWLFNAASSTPGFAWRRRKSSNASWIMRENPFSPRRAASSTRRVRWPSANSIVVRMLVVYGHAHACATVSAAQSLLPFARLSP